ncbi:MAG: hypothetical protein P4M04_01420 [Acidobacteriota bacterium]|nr:hypothetical protein [Acidobacteriota bacterium]
MLSPFHRKLWLTALLVLGISGTAVAQQILGELYATDASVKGSIVLAGSGTSVLSGSSIEAGAQTATLRLERGGSLLVCQGTKLSITASQSGRELLFSLNSGNLEMNYPLGSSADTLLTPDLRLLLPGPGTVHIAVNVTPQGDTCVQSLPSNVAAIVVSESMGDATYQVKPDEAVLFKGGHISGASRSGRNCECPVSQPTQVAKVVPPPAPPVETKPEPAAPKPAPPPPPEQYLTVEAPFVFRANDPVPDLSQNVATLKLENNKVVQWETVVLPPPEKTKKGAGDPQTSSTTANKEKKHGFFSRLGSFFATLFH